MIYIALYIDDLLVTVSENLVKWFNVNSQQCIDIVNTDTEMMRGGDYRQADGGLQSVPMTLNLTVRMRYHKSQDF